MSRRRSGGDEQKGRNRAEASVIDEEGVVRCRNLTASAHGNSNVGILTLLSCLLLRVRSLLGSAACDVPFQPLAARTLSAASPRPCPGAAGLSSSRLPLPPSSPSVVAVTSPPHDVLVTRRRSREWMEGWKMAKTDEDERKGIFAAERAPRGRGRSAAQSCRRCRAWPFASAASPPKQNKTPVSYMKRIRLPLPSAPEMSRSPQLVP